MDRYNWNTVENGVKYHAIITINIDIVDRYNWQKWIIKMEDCSLYQPTIEHSLSYYAKLPKFECYTPSDWLNHLV